HDVRMLQLRDRLDFAEEAIEGAAIVLGADEESLDGDGLAELLLFGAEDGAHAPGADLVQDAVVAEQQRVHFAGADAAELVRREEFAAEETGEKGVVVRGEAESVAQIAGQRVPALRAKHLW